MKNSKRQHASTLMLQTFNKIVLFIVNQILKLKNYFFFLEIKKALKKKLIFNIKKCIKILETF